MMDLAYKNVSDQMNNYMGADSKGAALFGECKWTNEKVGVGVLEMLLERSHLFKYKENYFYLFSRSGFTKDCMDAAKMAGNVELITFSDVQAVCDGFNEE